jgi:hypothetical protein
MQEAEPLSGRRCESIANRVVEIGTSQRRQAPSHPQRRMHGTAWIVRRAGDEAPRDDAPAPAFARPRAVDRPRFGCRARVVADFDALD